VNASDPALPAGSAAKAVTVTATRGGASGPGPRNQPKRAKKKPSGKRR
jgi:hypothetical protein